jgi:hypothetical protein
LESTIGYRSRFVRVPHKTRTKSSETATDSADPEIDAFGDSNSGVFDISKPRAYWHSREYHGNVVWPFEQVVIHQAGMRWKLKAVTETSSKMRHALHTLHKRILRHAKRNEKSKLTTVSAGGSPVVPAFFPEFFRPDPTGGMYFTLT